MDSWMDIARWTAAVVGAVLAVGAIVVGGMVWLLEHPDAHGEPK